MKQQTMTELMSSFQTGKITSSKKVLKPIFPNEAKELQIFHSFKNMYKIKTGHEFNSKANDGEAKHLVYTLIYYFQNCDQFFKSPLLYSPSGCKPSLSKGLCIFGGFGVGKSITLQVLKDVYTHFFPQNVIFKFILASEIVQEYETCEDSELSDFFKKYQNAFLVIDDVKQERDANRFGKINLLKEILFQRLEKQNTTTILLCNYGTQKNPNDRNIDNCIEDFNKYDNRIVDRLYGRMNFLQMHGKSLRK